MRGSYSSMLSLFNQVYSSSHTKVWPPTQPAVWSQLWEAWKEEPPRDHNKTKPQLRSEALCRVALHFGCGSIKCIFPPPWEEFQISTRKSMIKEKGGFVTATGAEAWDLQQWVTKLGSQQDEARGPSEFMQKLQKIGFKDERCEHPGWKSKKDSNNEETIPMWVLSSQGSQHQVT